MYDAARVRGLYTSLGEGWIYLNAGQCPQIPEKVASGVATSFRTAPLVVAPEPGSRHSSSTHFGSTHMASATRAVADLFSVRSDHVVLGPSSFVLARALAHSMSDRLSRSGVVGARDHALNSAFARFNLTIAEPDLGTGEIPSWQYHSLIDGSTRLVIVPGAHPYVGTATPVEEIADITHSASRAWVLLDATSLAPYRLIDIDSYGVDIVLVDLASLGGPQLSALVFRDTSMFPRFDHPLEVGPLSSGLLGGVAPLVDHYAGLVEDVEGQRSHRLRESMASLDVYLSGLLRHAIESLRGLSAVHLVGITGEAAGYGMAAIDRIPRLTFVVRGIDAVTVQQRLFSNSLVTSLAPQDPLLVNMGVFEAGGALSIGLAPFNTYADIDHLTRVLASLG